jgi:hypothetical protein
MAVAKQFSIPNPHSPILKPKKNSQFSILNPKTSNWRMNEKLENQLAYLGLRWVRTEREMLCLKIIVEDSANWERINDWVCLLLWLKLPLCLWEDSANWERIIGDWFVWRGEVICVYERIESVFGCPAKTLKLTSYSWNVISLCLVFLQHLTAAVRFHLQNRFLEKLLSLASWNRVYPTWKYTTPFVSFTLESCHFLSHTF